MQVSLLTLKQHKHWDIFVSLTLIGFNFKLIILFTFRLFAAVFLPFLTVRMRYYIIILS